MVERDVAAAGDLRTALQAAFDAAGVPLRAKHAASPGWLRVGAVVSAEDRHANVLVATDERLFSLDCWMRGVRMAAGRWRQYLKTTSTRAPHMVELYEFLTAAAREPQLRALLSCTSHDNLGFRPSVGEPRSQALVWVRRAGDGRYLVIEC